jgi:4-methylaminobutanoate oxidase (formaldehyde-forming)
VSLEFLSPETGAADAIARTPVERQARAAGARFETRDGWNLAVSYGSPDQESAACAETVGWVDVSHLRKLELQGSGVSERAGLELATATRRGDAWWCPLTPDRVVVIGEQPAAVREQAPEGTSIVDVSTAFAAMTLVGPQAREVFARFCAADLRPQVMPVAALRPVSIARQPGLIVREAQDRYLFQFGWAVGQYMWTVVQEAATHLGGRPVGLDALDSLEEPLQEMSSRA